MHVGTAQCNVPSQILLVQSVPTLHFLVSAHAPQDAPPQSMSVSSESITPSLQCIATQAPFASQTVPPLSVQVVPFAAFVVPHALPVHVLVLHSVVWAAQSVAMLHATQLPLPLQIFPPLSLQAVVLLAFVVPQALPVHVLVLHSVVCAAQSFGMLHATQLPLPSHTLPFVEQVAPRLLSAVPQHPTLQVGATQSGVVAVQSVGVLHDMAAWAQPVDVDAAVLVEEVVEPELPPVPAILSWATAAMSSHPATMSEHEKARPAKNVVACFMVPCAVKA